MQTTQTISLSPEEIRLILMRALPTLLPEGSKCFFRVECTSDSDGDPVHTFQGVNFTVIRESVAVPVP